MLQLRNKIAKGGFTVPQAGNKLFMRQIPKRMFSESHIRQNGVDKKAIIGVGVGTAGLSYLMFYGRKLSQQRLVLNDGQQLNFFNPIVKERISHALAYFGGGLMITGGLVKALSFLRIFTWNPKAFLLILTSLSSVSMFGTMATPYE